MLALSRLSTVVCLLCLTACAASDAPAELTQGIPAIEGNGGGESAAGSLPSLEESVPVGQSRGDNSEPATGSDASVTPADVVSADGDSSGETSDSGAVTPDDSVGPDDVEDDKDTASECELGALRCDGQDIQVCSVDPGGWLSVKTCESPEVCIDGQCACKPQCEGAECGDDGCGGSCGSCADGAACGADGQCEEPPVGCGELTFEGCCDGLVLTWCDGDEIKTQTCEDACGWSGQGGYYCGFEGEDPTGTFPLQCGGGCSPDCSGKACGDDGCGGSCGDCADGDTCSPEGQCICVPVCEGKSCGADGCGGSCGTCAVGEACTDAGQCKALEDPCQGLGFEGCCDGAVATWCDGGELKYADCEAPGSCGWGGEELGYICGYQGADPSGTYPIQCPWTTCEPECDGKSCGDDGCGGTCGDCQEGFNCESGQCIDPTCVPNCFTAFCGDDGCGGSCGTCSAGSECNSGICVPSLNAKVVFNVDMNCSGLASFETVYVSGPWADWCLDCHPLSDEDGDGIWTSKPIEFGIGIAFEYSYSVDNGAAKEDLFDDYLSGALCAPATDFSTYANRIGTPPLSGTKTLDDVYGSCGDCSPSDDAPTPCTYAIDCDRLEVCAPWPSADNQLYCSPRCSSQTKCAEGEVCTPAPGSSQVAYCRPVAEGEQLSGQTCNSSAECASRLCLGFVCRDACFRDKDCPESAPNCRVAESPTGDRVVTFCSGSGGTANGETCAGIAGIPADQSCASGHCDFLGDAEGGGICGAACGTSADCPAGQKCGLVRYGSQSAPDQVTYSSTFTDPLVDSFTGCYTPPQSLGDLEDGEECQAASDCKSGYCLNIAFGTNQAYCSRPCQDSVDCSNAMSCRLRALSMFSEWLEAYDQVDTNAWSMIWLCDFGD